MRGRHFIDVGWHNVYGSGSIFCVQLEPYIGGDRPVKAAKFYTKVLDYQGIAIRASEVVSDRALEEARRRLDRMLRAMPAALANLRTEGAELHIIGKNQVTSDLPEHAHWRGKPFDGKMTIDQRTRGVGGLYASCGEENLLYLKKDRYYGRDICIHEFAHTLMQFGLDEVLRAKIERQYHLSLADRRWYGMYAATNYDEYFAELSMWYFGTRGDYGDKKPAPRPGRGWFQKYDPDAFALVDSIYSGRTQPKNLKLVDLKALPPKQEGKLRSKKYDQPSTLRIANKTSKTVKMYWLDYQGKRKPYRDIRPGEVRFQMTYASHPFLLADRKGKALAIFVAAPQAAVANLVET